MKKNSKKTPAKTPRIVLVMSGSFKFYDAGESIPFDVPDDTRFPFIKKAIIPVGGGYCVERPAIQTDTFMVMLDKENAADNLIDINGDYYMIVDDMVTGNGDDQRILEWYAGIFQGHDAPKNLSNVIGAHYLLVFGGIGSPGAIPCVTCKSIVKVSDERCPHCGEAIQLMREDIERSIKERISEQPALPVLAGAR